MTPEQQRDHQNHVKASEQLLLAHLALMFINNKNEEYFTKSLDAVGIGKPIRRKIESMGYDPTIQEVRQIEAIMKCKLIHIE